MKDEELIRMANQIASFFSPYTEDEAVAGITDHLAKFWEPRMRKQLLAIKSEAKGLDPLVLRALKDPAITA